MNTAVLKETAKRNPPLLLTLVVTEKCNLDCIYCFVVNKSRHKMPLEIALRKVDKYLNLETTEFDHVVIDFTGGEPLLNFSLIRKVVDYVVSRKWRNKFSFFIGTNGTLITPEIREWSDRHRCVTFALSLDGTGEVHDKNRSGSYNAVLKNIDFFKKWPDQKVKMTIVPNSINNIARGIKNVHKLGMGVAANVVFENVWGKEKTQYLEIFDKQLRELVDFYFKNTELEPPYLVDMPIESLLFPKKKNEKFCGSGKNMITVDVNGIEYPCHRFLPMSSTNPNPKPNLRFTNIKPEECDNCALLTICPSCSAYNYECNSDIHYRTTYHCEFIKLQALASAKLKYLKLKRDVIKNPPDKCGISKGAKIKRTIESIRLLMDKFTV